MSTSSLRHSTWTFVRGKPSRMTPSRYSGLRSLWKRRSITSRSPTMLPASFRRRASGVSRRELMTMGPQVRPRVLAMKRVFVPLPAPGAPPSRMISLGKRSRSSPNSVSNFCQTAPKMICASLISRSVMRGAGPGAGRGDADAAGVGNSDASFSVGDGMAGGLADPRRGPDSGQAFYGKCGNRRSAPRSNSPCNPDGCKSAGAPS